MSTKRREGKRANEQRKTAPTKPVNILEEMEQTLAQKFESGGNFYTSYEYSDAPNPCFSLDNFGIVGLPLVQDIAAKILELPNGTRINSGKRNAKDQYGWEMTAEKVTLNNSAWERWVNETMLPRVCEALGVNSTTAKVTAEFDGVSLYGPGSCVSSNQSVPKAPKAFATMIVILSSEFEGGSFQIKHSEDRKVVDASTASSFSTQVIAWYDEASYSMEPVRSGYCLMFSYNLLSGRSTKPALRSFSPQAQRLREIFSAWKERKSPRHIVYLFRSRYSNLNLSKILRDEEGHIVRNLQAAAEPLGFRIHLAQVQVYGMGCGHDTIKDYEFDWSWSAVNLLNLEGQLVDFEDLEIDGDNVIPYDPTYSRPDKLDDCDNSAVQAWHHCTGVILWPEELDVENVGKKIASTYLGASNPQESDPNGSVQSKKSRKRSRQDAVTGAQKQVGPSKRQKVSKGLTEVIDLSD